MRNGICTENMFVLNGFFIKLPDIYNKTKSNIPNFQRNKYLNNLLHVFKKGVCSVFIGENINPKTVVEMHTFIF